MERKGGVLPVKVDVPVMLRGQRPHALEEVVLGIAALISGGLIRRGRVGVGGLGEA